MLPKKRLFIVGAGLSRAVHPEMPLAIDLMQTLAKKDETKKVNITGNLETSLAYLAQEHPFDRAAEGYARKILLQDAVRVIAEEIVKCQTLAIIDIPEWFYRLVGCLIVTNSDVVSFNYDLLIEHAVTGTSSFQPTHEPLSLWKPHGSLDKRWKPGKPTTIQQATAGLKQIKEQYLNGYEPFIVPPTTSKSSYYGADNLAEPWHKLRQSLENADEIVLMGFSAAEADFTVNGLLHDSFALRQTSGSSPLVYCVSHEQEEINRISARLDRMNIQVDADHCVVGIEKFLNERLIPEMTSSSFGLAEINKKRAHWPLFQQVKTSSPSAILVGNNTGCVGQLLIDGDTITVEVQMTDNAHVLRPQEFATISVDDFLDKASKAKRIVTSDGQLVLGFNMLSMGSSPWLITAAIPKRHPT